MPPRYLNPPTLFDAKPYGFSQVVVSPENGMAYLSGQTAWGSDQKMSGGADFGSQLRATLQNIERAVESIGCSRSDVVRVRVYIVNHAPGHLTILGRAMSEFFGEDSLPASTLVGVATLALPEFLVEIEADVVLTKR
jgi:enamine deaminase RidA (YjgF/YER057c/UK114 family)